jgi:Na+/H+ antiporter NhaD/arsenite permease-like protein
MMPALDWLQAHAADLGQPGPTFFYWATGTLSSFLDNAPTYLSFLSVGFGGFVTADLLASDPLAPQYLAAISVGAVFFGANTYIGNGPNFMVKAIADQKRMHTPSFLGYIFKYTLPCMIPTLLLVWFVFFRQTD